MSGPVRLAVLGPVLLAGPDGVLAPVPGTLARSFLVALALARGRALPTEALIDDLWGDEPPRGARAALQTLVSRLRRSAAQGIVASTGTGYRLELADGELDLSAALAVLESLRGEDQGDARVVAARADAALGSWRGEPGADLDGPLADDLAERADAVRGGLRRALANALLASGDPEAAVRLWTDEAEAHPFDEAAVGGRMRALAAAGRGAEAVAVFAAHRARLAEELGADPSADLVRLNADVLRRSDAPDPRVRRIGLRAAATALIGRDADLARVAELLTDNRLVTILGAGGLGKTRLAQDVAAGIAADTAVVLVELAPIGDADDLVPTLGALLGLAEIRTGRTIRSASAADLRNRVVGILAEQPTVLVLDNCEHLVADVAAFAGTLLEELPELRVLTTSRAPLAIPGEVVAPLAPLPVEADGAAVRLFTERARAARPGAVLPLDAVRRICTRLDGSPLAIELAAARIRGMGVDEIERRLDDRFALLRGGDRTAPERHRTLLAVIEWSWRLLGAGAQDLLTRLALFPDGVGVDAVEAVASDQDGALDDLAELVEQSLVQLTESEGEPTRYRLLETVREFGSAQLTTRGTDQDVRAAMLRWGTAFAADHVLTIATDQYAVFRAVERETDNLVVLLRWALRSEASSAVAHLFAALGSYWTVRGAQGEVAALGADVILVIVAGMRADGDEPLPEAERRARVISLVIGGTIGAFTDIRSAARAIPAIRRMMRLGSTGDAFADAQASMLVLLGRPAKALALIAEYRTHPDPRVAALALTVSAPLEENAGRTELALAHARRAEALAVSGSDAWVSGTAAVSMTQLLAQSGRWDEALRSAEVARERLERFGAEDDLAELGWSVGLAAAATGDVALARSVATEIGGRRESGRGFDDDRVQRQALAFVIGAEAARADGDLDLATTEYEQARTFLASVRWQAPHWRVMVASACIALAIERDQDPDATRSEGRSPGLQADARIARVGALAMLRLNHWWLDLPVVGTGVLGVALWGASTGRIPADDLAASWGIAVRLGARQDFAVLERERVRAVVARVTGDQALMDAETASAGLHRAEAVAASRALLERIVAAFRTDAGGEAGAGVGS